MVDVVSFTFSSSTTQILDYLTLPRLERLCGIERLIRRSACPLKYLAFDMTNGKTRPLRACMGSMPDSMTEQQMIWHGKHPGELSNILRPGILPQLTTLHFRGTTLHHDDYESFLDMVRRRRVPANGCAVLEVMTIHLQTYRALNVPGSMPRTSTMGQFRALARDDLILKLTVSGAAEATRVVFDSMVD
ncbi:hypothetical protein C8J57DRAFT_1530917 [Mycena rebaudengoi]|nr:hypothetical protein C8J57DRAFT_1530917 [Mycena rebaudengoi]